jgi:hypothetical protein
MKINANQAVPDEVREIKRERERERRRRKRRKRERDFEKK